MMYTIYCPEDEQLCEYTFTNIDDAVKTIKEWAMEDGGLCEFERYQIVEVKPIAEVKAEIKAELKYLD